MEKLRVRQDRIEKDLKELARFGATPQGGVTRIALTPEDDRAREYIMNQFREAGLEVTVDGIGNIFGRRAGREEQAPTLMMGSHIDTVINGGIFDGNAGVVAGLEVVRTLNDLEIVTPHPLELAVFLAEESVAFGKSCIGSRAFSGQLEPEQLRSLVHRDGGTLVEALQARGLEPGTLEGVVRDPGTLAAYLELHIEQADNLAEAGIPVGIVTGIAAATRLKVELKGEAGHSGASPMGRRKDALCAAAEVVLAVEEIASSQPGGTTVGTVGILKVEPGAINIVPGYTETYIDIRDIYSDSKADTVKGVQEAVSRIARRRDVDAAVTITASDEPVPTDPELVALLREAAVARDIPYQLLHSAAAHDAAYVAAVAPVGMVFVASTGGSHNPSEAADFADVALGAELLLEAVLNYNQA